MVIPVLLLKRFYNHKKMIKKPSLKDIAQKAGVSVTLVSYVLNNQQENRINKDTAKRIRAAASKLNYRTNQAARSLKTNKTLTLGLIVADISNPFFSGLARIIEDEAASMNYTVIFGSSDESDEKYTRLVDTFLNRQVDGLIIAPPQNSEAQIKYLQKQRTPFVLIDRYFPDVKTDYVILDNYGSAYDATTHLIKNGRKKIGFITYKTELVHLVDRKRGYMGALNDHNIKHKASWTKEIGTNNYKEEVEAAVKDLLDMNPSVDAILFASNKIATYAVKYINTLPLKVPDDLSIACFDETEALDLFYAPLTYIKQPLREIGQTAINILVEKLQNKNTLRQECEQGVLCIKKT